MKRPSLVVLGLIVATILTYVVCYRIATHETRQMVVADSGDGISWLRKEFSLTDDQAGAVTALQQEYEPRCMEMCARIMAVNREIEQLLKESSAMTPALEAALVEASRVQAECRKATLAQALAISGQMAPEQGVRYRAMMAKRILPGNLRHDSATHR